MRSSDRSRAAILKAARKRFAADGYGRATMRAIAADACIDPAMIIRYFGSKERLFVAAAQHDLALPDPRTIPRDRVGATLVDAFLSRWERDETIQVLLRASCTNPVAVEHMRSLFATQLVPVAVALLGDTPEAARRAALASSQILGLALCRFVLAFQPVVDMSREEIIAWIGPAVQHHLLGTS
ncbi:TetR family transcriptional regulator [Nonomuraea sp. B5E05]|uniref:TetR/AcrR family transcriptional regulator n=1 Tax=Nonomuraea sp. B5E05 TaxID=3153569 RepID=UPI003261BBFF